MRRRWGLTFLASVLALLLALTLQLGVFPASATVYGAPSAPHAPNAPNAPKDDSPTPTITATPATPPALTLAVPASGQGPVGAHLTITGSNWGTDDVLVGAAAPGASCANQGGWAQTFGHVRPQGDQSIVYTFDWPPSLGTSGGAYSICATNSAGTMSAFYQVVTASPPSLTLDPLTTNAGSLVKVTGQNFVGSGDVTLSVTDATGKTRDLTTLTPDATGGFSLTFQPRPTDVGDEVMHATTSAPQGMRPALQADAKLHVGAALTPTPGATPTAVIVAPVKQPGGNNTALVLVIALVVGFLLAAAAVGAAIFFFVMRNRKRPDDGTGYQAAYGGGGNPGYGMTGAYGAPYGNSYQDDGYTGYGAGIGGAGGMGAGSWDATTTMQDPYASQQDYGAGTSGWPASDEPDPNWRPRPMTGQWRAPEDYADSPYDAYGNDGPDASGQYPPNDPWGTPGGSSRQPGQPYGAGQGQGQRPSGPGGNPRAGRYPPADPRNRGSRGGPGGSRGGGASGTGGAQDWYPERRSDNEW